MSSTNTTPNFGLPQYIPTDKPTYLGDFNKAMLDIDTNMKSIENKAQSAESGVETANSNATQALNTANTARETAQTAQATATEAQTKASQAQTTASQAQTTASQAQTTASQNATNINSIKTWENYGNVLTVPTTGSSNDGLNVKYNSSLQLLNLWGYNHFSPVIESNAKIGQLPESFPKPIKNRSIANAGVLITGSGNQYPLELKIDTTGAIYNNTKYTMEYCNINTLLITSDWFSE
jgi:hypothetical protein